MRYLSLLFITVLCLQLTWAQYSVQRPKSRSGLSGQPQGAVRYNSRLLETPEASEDAEDELDPNEEDSGAEGGRDSEETNAPLIDSEDDSEFQSDPDEVINVNTDDSQALRDSYGRSQPTKSYSNGNNNQQKASNNGYSSGNRGDNQRTRNPAVVAPREEPVQQQSNYGRDNYNRGSGAQRSNNNYQTQNQEIVQDVADDQVDQQEDPVPPPRYSGTKRAPSKGYGSNGSGSIRQPTNGATSGQQNTKNYGNANIGRTKTPAGSGYSTGQQARGQQNNGYGRGQSNQQSSNGYSSGSQRQSNGYSSNVQQPQPQQQRDVAPVRGYGQNRPSEANYQRGSSTAGQKTNGYSSGQRTNGNSVPFPPTFQENRPPAPQRGNGYSQVAQQPIQRPITKTGPSNQRGTGYGPEQRPTQQANQGNRGYSGATGNSGTGYRGPQTQRQNTGNRDRYSGQQNVSPNSRPNYGSSGLSNNANAQIASNGNNGYRMRPSGSDQIRDPVTAPVARPAPRRPALFSQY